MNYHFLKLFLYRILYIFNIFFVFNTIETFPLKKKKETKTHLIKKEKRKTWNRFRQAIALLKIRKMRFHYPEIKNNRITEVPHTFPSSVHKIKSSQNLVIHNLIEALLMAEKHPNILSTLSQYRSSVNNIKKNEDWRFLPSVHLNFFDFQGKSRLDRDNHITNIGPGAGANMQWDLWNVFNSNKKFMFFTSQEQYYQACETKNEINKKVLEYFIQTKYNKELFLLLSDQLKSLEQLKLNILAEYHAGKLDEGAVSIIDSEIAECMYRQQRCHSALESSETQLKALTQADSISDQLVWIAPDLTHVTLEEVIKKAQKTSIIQKLRAKERILEEKIKNNNKLFEIHLKIGGDASLTREKRTSLDPETVRNVSGDAHLVFSKSFSLNEAMEKNNLSKEYQVAIQATKSACLKSHEDGVILWNQATSSSHNIKTVNFLLKNKKKQEEALRKGYERGQYSMNDVLKAREELYKVQQSVLEAEKERYFAVGSLYLFMKDKNPSYKQETQKKSTIKKSELNLKNIPSSHKRLIVKKSYNR